MIWTLLSQWKVVASLIGFAAILATGIYVQSLRHENSSLRTNLDVAEANYTQLKTVREAERNASSEFQSKNTALRNQLNAARKLRTRCVPTVPPNSTGHSPTAAGTELFGGDGIDTGYLLDFAGRAEETRLKLIACQQFNKGTNNGR